jgi:hypothetical protein
VSDDLIKIIFLDAADGNKRQEAGMNNMIKLKGGAYEEIFGFSNRYRFFIGRPLYTGFCDNGSWQFIRAG